MSVFSVTVMVQLHSLDTSRRGYTCQVELFPSTCYHPWVGGDEWRTNHVAKIWYQHHVLSQHQEQATWRENENEKQPLIVRYITIPTTNPGWHPPTLTSYHIHEVVHMHWRRSTGVELTALNRSLPLPIARRCWIAISISRREHQYMKLVMKHVTHLPSVSSVLLVHW